MGVQGEFQVLPDVRSRDEIRKAPNGAYFLVFLVHHDDSLVTVHLFSCPENGVLAITTERRMTILGRKVFTVWRSFDLFATDRTGNTELRLLWNFEYRHDSSLQMRFLFFHPKDCFLAIITDMGIAVTVRKFLRIFRRGYCSSTDIANNEIFVL